MDRACKDCLYWVALNKGERKGGECRYNPPIPSGPGVYRGLFPLTNKKDWCGRFELRDFYVASDPIPKDDGWEPFRDRG